MLPQAGGAPWVLKAQSIPPGPWVGWGTVGTRADYWKGATGLHRAPQVLRAGPQGPCRGQREDLVVPSFLHICLSCFLMTNNPFIRQHKG